MNKLLVDCGTISLKIIQKSHCTTFRMILLRTCFVHVIGEGLLDCETIFVKFTILEFKGNLGYRSMRCLISVS